MTDASETILVSNAVIILGGLAKVLWDIATRNEARKDRAQNRLDREQDLLQITVLAQLTENQLQVAKSAGDTRMKKLISEISQTRHVSIQAFKEANNVNKKILEVGLQYADKTKVPTAMEQPPKTHDSHTI